MQATLDARALKPFTKALTCISRFGDEMIMHASAGELVLTSMNQARTAFCSITYRKGFFQKYSVAGARTQAGSNNAGPSRTTANGRGRDGEGALLKCQLQTKALLAILRHKNTDKNAEKCELTIIDGVEIPDEEVREDEDTLESRLIVRLHCRHGVIKTHRLLLNDPTNDSAPVIQSGDDESKIVVQARAVKEIIDLFPTARGPKSDPELVWRFDANEVKIKNVEKGMDGKGKSQLATELQLDSDEFDTYDVALSPVTIGFFQREFNAAVLLGDALVVPIDFRFTRTAEPIYISFDADDSTMLFVLATHAVRGADTDDAEPQLRRRPQTGNTSQQNGRRLASGVAPARKRAFGEGDEAESRADSETPAAEPRRPRTSARPQRIESSRSPAELHPPTAGSYAAFSNRSPEEEYPPPSQSQPLFLASQLSQTDLETIRAAGLGIEDMDAEQFAEMLNGDGEEVNFGLTPPRAESTTIVNGKRLEDDATLDDELELDDFEDVDMGPTQHGSASDISSEKAFRPLFED